MHYALTAIGKATLLATILYFVAGCASSTSNPTIKPRQTLECPYGMMLICEGQNEPSQGGDDEIPEYDRCYCELNPV